MLDSQGGGSRLPGHLGSGIGGSVIHHDHLVRFGENFHGRADAAQAPANPQLFIMCWDNEGDHGGIYSDPACGQRVEGQQLGVIFVEWV